MKDRIEEMIRSGDVEMANLGVKLLIETEPDFDKVEHIVNKNVRHSYDVLVNQERTDIELKEIQWNSWISVTNVNYTSCAISISNATAISIDVSNCISVTI